MNRSSYLLACAFLSIGLFACQNTSESSDPPINMNIDLQGHRGCRGLLPENTIPAFLRAIDIGVNTLELDVVISADRQVVVSHEPFFNHEISQKPDGTAVSEEEEKSLNLYQMDYATIQTFDVGMQPHPRFPDQQKIAVSKPLLRDVIAAAEAHAKAKGKAPLLYNIETKSLPETDNQYHPEPARFVELLLAEVQKGGILERTTIQSFDPRTLQVIHPNNPGVKLALLIENTDSPEDNLNQLGFTPDIYSPYFVLVNEALMTLANEKGMQVIPWTLNETEDMKKMLKLGVHGIISDYPDRVVALMDK
ncbi:MAG: glycerophosphodiester phosphodiesterase family protein [Bacteroidota bacterium]